MDSSSLEELVYDPSKCNKLSIEQKRELVYEMAKWSDAAAEMLSAWSRQEILQILCAELGKERKYTGLTKSKIIELLLKIIDERKSHEKLIPTASDPSEINERNPKRQRKTDNVYCKNSACKARMNHDHAFCRRCSCCICRKYDDNKDPSLWLICNSDPPFDGILCGVSCHLECVLHHQSSGISKDGQVTGSNERFYCSSCGKMNDLLCSWRKQMVVARDTRRVDILCYRLSLAQKIISGTRLNQNLYSILEEAVKKLEEEVGPLTGLPVKMARGIVNRLSSGTHIQKLCATAVDSLDSMLSSSLSDGSVLPSKHVRLEEIRASSLTLVMTSDHLNKGNDMGYLLWHRKADDLEYPSDPSGRLFVPNTSFRLSGLTPATDYSLKVVAVENGREICVSESQFRTRKTDDDSTVESIQSPATNCSSLSNPYSMDEPRVDSINCSDQAQKEMMLNGDGSSSLEEEETIRNTSCIQRSSDTAILKKKLSSNGSDTPQTGLECVPCGEGGRKIMPSKLGNNNGTTKKKIVKRINTKCEEPQVGSSSKKQDGEKQNDDHNDTDIGDKQFEYCVKVMRWLECDGHVEATFRQKFLTWYSMKANSREVRAVKAFIDSFGEDPQSLAGQLVDTFSDLISNQNSSSSTVVPYGFCFKLWH